MEKLKQQARGARTKLTKLGSWFRRHLAFSIILGTVVLAFIGSLIFVTVYYRDKAAPGVTIANIQVGGQTKEQVVDSLANLIKNMRLSLTYGGKSATASADDLGINIDTDKLADEATQTGQGNPFSVVLTHKHFDLTGSYDKEKVQSFITTNFPELTTDPIDAQVVYDKNQNKYTTQPGAVGKSVKLDELYAKVENMLRNPGLANYEIATSDDNPTISNESAQATTNQLNNTLSQSIQIVNNGRVIWTLDPWDEASWISLSANPATGQYDISYDLDKIKGFVSDTIVDQLPGKPVNQQAITNANGEIYQVVTPGRNGQVASNTDEVANQIKNKLSSAAGGKINLTTKDAPYGTDKWVTTNGGHWVEANLSTYEVRLYDGKNVVWSTNQTSHGKASTPTITGLFKVWHKVEEQCMPNPPSTQPLCHIRKVTYFEKSGYAFHEAWWMSAANGNVRQGISHGCINMYYEDAKRVYDWSPIGTPVWVHW